MSTVWMKHPDLPDAPPVEVDSLSVPHHQAAGWEPAPAPARGPIVRMKPPTGLPPEPQPAPVQDEAGQPAEPPAADEPDAQQPETPKGRRITTKKEGTS